MAELVTKKPCIDVCEFKRSVCTACGRTQAEKKQWKQLPDTEKNAIWARVLQSHGKGNSPNSQALRARYRKALKKAAEKKQEKAWPWNHRTTSGPGL